MTSHDKYALWSLVALVLFALAFKALDVWEAREDAKYRAPVGRAE